MADEIVWEDPPPAGRGPGPRGKWAAMLAPLRERPGQWAKLGRHRASTVTCIRKGRYSGIAAGDFEAEGREFDKNTASVMLYARFVGKPVQAVAS